MKPLKWTLFAFGTVGCMLVAVIWWFSSTYILSFVLGMQVGDMDPRFRAAAEPHARAMLPVFEAAMFFNALFSLLICWFVGRGLFRFAKR